MDMFSVNNSTDANSSTWRSKDNNSSGDSTVMASELHVDAIKHSGGTSALTIDSSGRVNMPRFICSKNCTTYNSGGSNTHSLMTTVDFELTVDQLQGLNSSNSNDYKAINWGFDGCNNGVYSEVVIIQTMIKDNMIA